MCVFVIYFALIATTAKVYICANALLDFLASLCMPDGTDASFVHNCITSAMYLAGHAEFENYFGLHTENRMPMHICVSLRCQGG